MSHESARTPGQLIKALLAERGWAQQVLAIVMGVDKAIVTRLVANKKPVDAKTALVLSDVFDVPAERFLELQTSYELAMARIVEQPDPERRTRAQLYGNLPVAEMIKRGWIDAKDVRDLEGVERGLTEFFGVETVDEIEIFPHAAKKTHVFSPVTSAQLAWLYRVKQIASGTLVGRYSPSAVKAAVTLLQPLRASVDEARHVPRILMEAGVRVVIVEALPSAGIDGVCFWLDDFSPVIGMSLRHDRIDNFWFVLRHELEHVIQRHGHDSVMVDVDLDQNDGDLAVEERVANQAAADFCVPSDQLERFIERKDPFFAERDIIGFARTLKVHPGLVAGQLRRRTGRFNRFHNHLAKIRSTVIPNAMVDGWGDVVPAEY